MRQALVNDVMQNEILHDEPGQVFWLIEEIVSFKRIDRFYELLQNGQEIMWRSDDIFPFIMFYIMCPFMVVRQFFSK